ncbi:hypothetical protein IEO21_08177 [Rhodonia placenta]|uniref:Uncharacterized protein n=1 Tax=Rhodonia placenta TaxID=104341 RepID=A0A8H7TZN2_9APHY|nr:hypothetical protein IEO21_08177 [Postia placenta]
MLVARGQRPLVTGTSSEARSGKDPDVELSRASEETSEDSRTKGAPILALIRRLLHSVRTTGLWTSRGRAGEGYYCNRNQRGARARSRYKQIAIYEWPLVSKDPLVRTTAV